MAAVHSHSNEHIQKELRITRLLNDIDEDELLWCIHFEKDTDLLDKQIADRGEIGNLFIYDNHIEAK